MAKHIKFLIASSLVITISIVAAIVNNRKFSIDFATNDPLWYHYVEIPPTEERHGSKEFWANCSTHQFSLTLPESDDIQEGVAFDTTEYFNQLTLEDARYIPSLHKQKDLGIIPVENEGKLSYGLYPQTHCNDEDAIAYLNTLDAPNYHGWYVYNNNCYMKSVAEETLNWQTFTDGTVVEDNELYWFKAEPIVWRILDTVDGDKLLFSEMILDFRDYYHGYENRTSLDGNPIVYPNNYKYSDIRPWLNDDFYNLAFSLNDEYVKTTLVDNSNSSIDPNKDNPYYCSDTQDKVFLLNLYNFKNTNYGFENVATESATRVAHVTDWVQTLGHVVNNNRTLAYFTRSPANSGNQRVSIVDTDGSLVLSYNSDMRGIRPLITFGTSE